MVKQIDDQTKIREYPVTTSNDSFYHCHVELRGIKRSTHPSTLQSLLTVCMVPNLNPTFDKCFYLIIIIIILIIIIIIIILRKEMKYLVL